MSKKEWTGNNICTVVKETYTNADHMYLGPPEMAQALTEKFKIEKFFSRKKDTIATIGWSPKKGDGGNWYGWSHRAISSFPTRKRAEKFAEEVG